MTRSPTNDEDGAEKTRDATRLEPASEKPDMAGDRANFFFLMLLYVMQGASFGFTVSALPLILQSAKIVNYEDQALFSLALWPSSMKLVWAPIVDAVYIQRIGRRKSWLHPIQYLQGAILMYSANNINGWLQETGKPNMVALTSVFVVYNLLSSVENIVADGWALTMLRKANIGYSSVSSSSGFAIGILLGSTIPVLITSEEFRKYLHITRDSGGIMTLESFLFVWDITLILITTLIWIFKKEKDHRLEDNHVQLSIVQNYKLLWDILKLPSIRILLLALVTMKVGFSAARNSLTNLKLVDAGVPKDDLMILNTAMFVVKILTPLVVSKFTSGPRPMSICLNVMPIRLLWSLTYILFVYFTPMLINHNDTVDVPIYYYLILGCLNAVNEALCYIMLVAASAFFSRISDSRFGGTYMTLLYTVSNLGIVWSSSLGLKMMNYLTFKQCSNDHLNNCHTNVFKNMCDISGGECKVIVDGYFVEIIICMIIGVIWFGIFKNILKNFETKDPSHWLIYADGPKKTNAKPSTNATSE